MWQVSTGKIRKKMTIHSKEEMDQIVREIEHEKFFVDEVKVSERLKKAPLPFTTSTLQQEASKVLNFATQKTMRIAQHCTRELISKAVVRLVLSHTSVRIPQEFRMRQMQRQGEYIREVYGENFVAEGEKKKAF